jgi:hypothetical protein
MTRALRGNAGVISASSLAKLGFSHDEVLGLVAHGALRRLHRGVYADGRAPLSDQAYLKAALLALGGRAWLSGWAAAMAWGLVPLSIPRLEVTVVAPATPRQRPGLRVRSVRTSPHHSEIRGHKGLRVSSIPRLLIETAAGGGSDQQLDALIEQAVRRNRLEIPDLATTLTRNTGQRGSARVRKICTAYLPHTDRKSGLERSFDRWLTRHPEIPAPQRNVHLGPWELDCFWPNHRLALELDGRPYHTVINEIERDHRKDTWLQTHGIRILRVTDTRFKRNKPSIHQDLTTMLALGREQTGQTGQTEQAETSGVTQAAA